MADSRIAWADATRNLEQERAIMAKQQTSKKAPTAEFPGEVYVWRQQEGDESYLQVAESIDEVPEGTDVVAQCRPVQFGNLLVTREFVPTPIGR